MNNNNETILFDDRQVRIDGVYERRKRDYIIAKTATFVLVIISVICAFFDRFAIIFLIPYALLVHFCVLLEWMKVKNHHLVVRNNQIEITDRFNKTTVHKVNVKELTLELRKPNARGRGILLQFYDSKHNLICEYEDMLNAAAPYGQEKTIWEKSIEESGIKIVDNEYVIKNKNHISV